MIRISVTLDDIGYGEILEKLAASGAVQENTELGFLAAGLRKYGRQSVDLLPEAAKESLAVRALNQYSDQLCAGAERLLEQSGIPAHIADLTVERTEGK